jgi:hypothetical protein
MCDLETSIRKPWPASGGSIIWGGGGIHTHTHTVELHYNFIEGTE